MVVAISPVTATVKINRFWTSLSPSLDLTMSEADRWAINDLFTVAMMGGMRRDLILVDGGVVSRRVASVFSGPILDRYAIG